LFCSGRVEEATKVGLEFDKLNRQVVKLQDGGKAPKSYIKCIAELEDFMNETLAKQKVTPKKMNATAARGLNAVKQRIKKNNKDYQSQIDAFRKDSDAFMESDEEVAPVPKPTRVKFQEPVPTEGAAEDEEKPFTIVNKHGKAVAYSPESIQKHLRAIIESRGRKNTDRGEQIMIMEELNKVAETPYLKIRVLQTLVSARFDLGAGTATSMPLEHWKAAERELSALLTLLETHKDHVVIEGAEEWDDDEKTPVMGPDDKYIKVPGSVVSYIERLDDELTRSLQNIDPHTSEYIERLTDEASLYNIILQGLLYYETIQKDASLEVPQESLNRIIQRRLDHVYFKVRHSQHRVPRSFYPR
jgi:translation initiation factor 3 subunit C